MIRLQRPCVWWSTALVLSVIGTTSPQTRLHLYNANDAVYSRVQGSTDGDNYAAFETWNTDGTPKKWQFAHKSLAGITNDFHFTHFDGTRGTRLSSSAQMATWVLYVRPLIDYFRCRSNTHFPLNIAPISGSGDIAIDTGTDNSLKYYNGSTWVSTGGIRKHHELGISQLPT